MSAYGIQKFLKFLPVTLFRDRITAFWKPPVSLKVVPKPACDPENCSESRLWIYIGKNRPTRAEKAATEIYAACGTIFRITVVSVFKEASENFILIFLLN